MPTPSYPSASNDPGYRPSAGTALTAAGLAIPGGLVSIIVGIGAISGTQAIDSGTPGGVAAGIYIALIAGFLSGLALLIGAGLIFGGKPVGRWLVVFGCVVVVIALIIVSAMVGNQISDVMSSQDNYNNGAAAATGAAIGIAVVYSIPAIATLVLAIVPVTGRYLAYRSSGVSSVISPVQGFGYQAPQQQGYGQQSGYPQQQGFPPSTPGGFPQQQGFPPATPGGFPQQQGGYPQQGGFPQAGGDYPQSNPGGFPQQPPSNPAGFPQQPPSNPAGFPQQPPNNPPQQW